ncbi:uncharacterized protein ACA1_045930 [Acanthamoeba castellanii str. Neff]|uniref:Uncharacterized protein n=1 Tax=Acanthamoeba castellanii (strain ATCC 30010 / Neff) TaxID=1257118 RepID=L8H9M8_ACACF|nr:uncharacterized protein ACA1_045930 [Acanthamoeba castellanii str. Neff]ELR21895.1 hypothetical protein ACA1_045930 [Acanthamoeba castellanii str. Neff]
MEAPTNKRRRKDDEDEPSTSDEEKDQEETQHSSPALIIAEIERSKIIETDARLKKMGITYDQHQLRYLNSTKTLYVQIPEDKVEAITEHVRRHLGWGSVSTGDFPSTADDQENDQDTHLFLGLRLPEGHKKGVEKNDVILAAKKKGITLATTDFDLEFYNSRNYRIRMADEKLANDLRHQANFILHGVDVSITSWKKNRYQEYFSVTIANIGNHVNRTELVRLASAYAGEPAMSATHLKDDYGLLRPVSIIGFLTPQGQAKALELNGKKKRMGRHKEPLKVTRTLTNDERDKLDKEREERKTSNAGRAQHKRSAAERRRIQAAQREEEYRKAREHVEEDDTPIFHD